MSRGYRIQLPDPLPRAGDDPMSLAYRITVKESATRRLTAEDEICSRLELLEILPPEDMANLLREELKNRGFEEQPDGTLLRHGETVSVRINPQSGEVTVSAAIEKTVSQQAERITTGFDDVGPTPRKLRQQIQKELQADLEKKFEQEQQHLQSQAAQVLEQHLHELQPEISEIVNKVTREALKQKAHQMGTVKEISEDPQSGSLTITVEV